MFYPESPIHLLQDGGPVDFGPLCALPQYACTFEVVQGENSRWNPHSWFARMRAAALRLHTTFLIYLEPDVLVRRRHITEPQHDAGGIFDNYNPAVHEETVAYVERRGRERVPCFQLEWKHFGLAGGSYFRAEAVIDAFDPAHVQRIDWGPMQWREGDKTMSSDFAMVVALACRGWKVSPWNESAQNFERRGLPPDEAGREEFRRQWPAYNPSAAFEHDHKEHYSDTVPEEHVRLVRELPQTPQTCHGCIWYGAEGVRLPGPEPPRPPRAEDWYSTTRKSNPSLE
ncbi:unnamed protein product [Prorocentrum cordatum]|uniref:Uncharacterized protein n=1 Tax=Prorocentrum cordatum TaxID=2364126 RepID=A0ABN9SI85_9DINO|nr:unnamed protein product [Polarella glacialis]